MSAPWTDKQVRSDEVSKKMILAHLQEHADAAFLAAIASWRPSRDL